MKTIVLEIDVKDDELKKLNQDLGKTADNLNSVEKESSGASKGLKSVGENGGAIAVLDSVTGGLATRIRDAYEASKLFNTSLKGTRTALIATGIGAFVVALGLVVAYWEDIDNWVKGVNKRLENTVKLTENRLGLLDKELSIIQKQQELNELIGEGNENLLIQEQEILNKKKESLLVLLDTLKTQLAIEQSREKDLTFIEKAKVGFATIFGSPTQIANAVTEGLGFNFISELTGKIKDVEASILDVEIASERLLRGDPIEGTKPEGLDKGQRQQEEAELASDGERARQEAIAAIIEEFRLKRIEDEILQLEEERNKQILELERLSATEQEKADIINFYDEQIEKEKDKRRADELKKEQILQQQKLSLASQTLGQISSIIGENSKVGKIAASAQALINTWQGVTQVWKSDSVFPEPFATIQKGISTGVVLASGLNAVKEINKTKLPAIKGASGGAGGGASVSASVPQPNFNVVGNTGINQIANVVGDQLQAPVKAFVVMDEINTAQELEANAIEGSTIT